MLTSSRVRALGGLDLPLGDDGAEAGLAALGAAVGLIGADDDELVAAGAVVPGVEGHVEPAARRLAGQVLQILDGERAAVDRQRAVVVAVGAGLLAGERDGLGDLLGPLPRLAGLVGEDDPRPQVRVEAVGAADATVDLIDAGQRDRHLAVEPDPLTLLEIGELHREDRLGLVAGLARDRHGRPELGAAAGDDALQLGLRGTVALAAVAISPASLASVAAGLGRRGAGCDQEDEGAREGERHERLGTVGAGAHRAGKYGHPGSGPSHTQVGRCLT